MVSNNKNSEFKTVNKLTIKQVFVAKKIKLSLRISLFCFWVEDGIAICASLRLRTPGGGTKQNSPFIHFAHYGLCFSFAYESSLSTI